MRHNKKVAKLGRNASHRKAMLRNMVRALLTHERIRTTETKAKELSRVADKLVTLALRNDLHARRQAYKVLENHQLVAKLFDDIGPRFSGVPGGFTRVVKLGLPRLGDAACLAVIELSRQAGEPAKSEKAPKAEKTPKAVTAPAAPVETAPAASTEAAVAPPVETAPVAPPETASDGDTK